MSSIQDYLSEGWQGPSCNQAYCHQSLRGGEAKEGGGSLASFPYLPCLSFQGYLLGSLGLMVLGGMVLYLLFDGFAYFQGVSLSICFVDIYGLVNAKNRLSYQILKWMEYRALEMNHYEPFF